FVPRFAAEPPQEETPYGRWEQRLREELLGAVPALQAGEPALGEPGELVWYPDRSWHGRTYVPATCSTSSGYELFGYVRFVAGSGGGGEASDFTAQLDFTDETAARNPDWELDLCDEVIGSWRGEAGAIAAMTLVWGHPLLSVGRVATAELAGVTVDQCAVANERFTLIAPDDYRHDLLEIALYDARGRELARESLYAGEDDDAPDEGEGEPDEG
ncbi:MAG TPA: hypothetical protein VNZ05_01645, partial [Solirubrobacteraceae bacterium]|nr:hypothetical protein [Solirubrobacteraceae bacterium]